MAEIRSSDLNDDSGNPAGLRGATRDHVVRPAPEVVLLLDKSGRIIRSSGTRSGERLKSFSFDPGKTVHEALHPDCDDQDCSFDSHWRRAWQEHQTGMPTEWFVLSRGTQVGLRLRLQPVNYACGVLFGEVRQRYVDCSVLFVRDFSAMLPHSVSADGSDSAHIKRANLYQLRRSSDPDPSLVAALDERLRSITGRLLVSQEAERKRIAAELHDSLGQSLSLLRMEIEVCLEVMRESAGPAGAVDHLERIYKHARSALEDLRDIVRNLRPSVVDDAGLVGALNLLCEDLRTVNEDLDIQVNVVGSPRRLPDELSLAVYRIAQEALHNVLRHARASTVSLEFDAGEGAVTLEICDDGVGIPDDLPTRRGLGLVTIRERAETLGGSYDIDSKPGNGCRIRVSWPEDAVKSLRQQAILDGVRGDGRNAVQVQLAHHVGTMLLDGLLAE